MRVGRGVAESGAVEIGQWFTDGDGRDHDCDKKHAVSRESDQEGQVGVEVEDVGD